MKEGWSEDQCLVEEIENLKKENVTIHFSACDEEDRFIVVSNRDILKMKELGYKINGKVYYNDKTYNTYEPKSVCSLENEFNDDCECEFNDDDNDDYEEIEIIQKE